MSCKKCGSNETTKANPDYCYTCWSAVLLNRKSINTIALCVCGEPALKKREVCSKCFAKQRKTSHEKKIRNNLEYCLSEPRKYNFDAYVKKNLGKKKEDKKSVWEKFFYEYNHSFSQHLSLLKKWGLSNDDVAKVRERYERLGEKEKAH